MKSILIGLLLTLLYQCAAVPRQLREYEQLVKGCWKYNESLEMHEASYDCRDKLYENGKTLIGQDTSYASKLYGTRRLTQSARGIFSTEPNIVSRFTYDVRFLKTDGIVITEMFNVYFTDKGAIAKVSGSARYDNN